MANSISVLEKDQRPGNIPRFHVKRTVAKLLVARKAAKWITETLIQLQVALMAGFRDPLRALMERLYPTSDLLPELSFYMTAPYPLPRWLLRSYE